MTPGVPAPLWDLYPGVVLELSAQGVIAASNGRLERERSAVVVGTDFADLLEPSSREKWRGVLATSGRGAQALEVAFEGGESYTLRTFALLRAPEGGPPRWLVEQPDVLSGKDVYEAITAMNADLATTQRELSRERVRLERALKTEAQARAVAESSRARLALLERIGESALGAADLDTLLRAAARGVRETLGVDVVNVLLLDSEGATLRTGVSDGIEGASPDVAIPLEAGAIGRAAARRETAVMEDLSAADLVRESLKDILASMAVAPLVAGEQLLGMLEVGTVERRHFTDDDVTLLQVVAQRLAAALERRRLWEAERAANAAAQAALRQRDEVLAIVAHDLRNPLSRIQMATHALSLQLPAEADRKAADIALRAIRGMDRLIQDLLDVGRLEGRGLQLESSPVEIAPLLSDLDEQFRPLAAAAGITFESAADPAAVAVRADRPRLFRVFANLIDNALRVTPAGGRVRITASPAREFVEFRVEDTGPGIDAEQLPHVFDRFWQGTRERRGSAGLGLAIVKGVVEAHGGRVFVESEPGAGATFRFWIPAAS